MIKSAGSGGFEFFRKRDYAKICAILVEDSLNEEITAHENMTRHSFAKLTEGVRNPHHFLHDRHVTILAGLLTSKVAVEPFLVRHLFRKFTDLLSAGSQGSCD